MVIDVLYRILTHDLTFAFTNEAGTRTVDLKSGLTAVPVQRNWRTNIVGTLLTGNVSLDITLSQTWDGETAPSYIADGVTYDNLSKTYSISNANGLAWVANQANTPASKAAGDVYNPGDFSGKDYKNVKLAADIDLEGKEWTPIGNSDRPFQGIFDGDGKTISNLKISGNNSNVGLFGFTTVGEVKNLTVNNAEVSGYLNVGVVAGTPYNSKYANIKVTGLVKVDGFSYVGGVGGKNVYADWTDVTVDVEPGSYVNAQSDIYRTYVGGVAGFIAEGKKTLTNIKSNIDVIGSTCDVGGLFGMAHHGTSYVNCSCSGNVEITSALDPGDDEEIGGIAGVWHNEDGTTVTFTGCTFTGTLKTNLGADLSDNTIVGRKYMQNGTGRLIIDGRSFVADGVISDMNTSAIHISNAKGFDWLVGQIEEGKDFDSETIIIDDDITLSEGSTWTPIGTGSTPFAGTIEGNNKVISGIRLSADSEYAGFVGKLDYGAVIKDVVLRDIDITAETNLAGAIAGYNQGFIYNCHVEGGTITSNQSNVGGITGINAGTGGAVIAGCSVKNLTINGKEGSSYNGGGIAASNTTGAVIIACYTENLTLNGFQNAAGIVALNAAGYGRKIGKVIGSYSVGCGIGDTKFDGSDNLYKVNSPSTYGYPIINTCFFESENQFVCVDAEGDDATVAAPLTAWTEAQAKMNEVIRSWNSYNSDRCPLEWGDTAGFLVEIL